MRQREVGVVDAGVRHQEGQGDDGGQPVDLADQDKHQRTGGDGQQRVDGHLVGTALGTPSAAAARQTYSNNASNA